MPALLQLQKLPGKGGGGWKVSLRRCLAYQKIVSSWRKKCVLGHPIAQATSYCLLPDTFWLQASKNTFKVGSVKFANSLSLPSIVKKVKAAKGLKWCQAKVKRVNNPINNPAWTAQYKWPPREPYFIARMFADNTAVYKASLSNQIWLMLLCEGEEITFLVKMVTVCCTLTNMCPNPSAV